MKRCLHLFLGMWLGALLCVAPALAADGGITLRMGHAGPVNSSLDVGLRNIAKEIQAKSNGAITIQVYPQSQLGSEEVMLDSVASGTLDIAIPSTSVLATIIPQFNALSLPFLFNDDAEFHNVVGTTDFIDRTNALFAGKNVVIVGYLNAMMRGLSNTRKEVRSPADMRGLKIRVMAGPIYTDMFRAMGVTTSTIPFAELYSALQQGVVDGEDNNLYVMNIVKLMEVEKHHTVLNHTVQCNVFMVNEGVWKKLSAAHQSVVREAINRHVAGSLEVLKKDVADAEKAAAAKNVKVVRLSGAELQVFRDAVKPVHAKYRSVVGSDFYDYLMKQVDQQRR